MNVSPAPTSKQTQEMYIELASDADLLKGFSLLARKE